MQYQSVLSEALKDTEIDLEVSNGHMFENKLARHDAMNSLASHYYQMYEFERQRVPASSLPATVQPPNRQKSSKELSKQKKNESGRISNS